MDIDNGVAIDCGVGGGGWGRGEQQGKSGTTLIENFLKAA